jgi:hypothetical protein
LPLHCFGGTLKIIRTSKISVRYPGAGRLNPAL